MCASCPSQNRQSLSQSVVDSYHWLTSQQNYECLHLIHQSTLNTVSRQWQSRLKSHSFTQSQWSRMWQLSLAEPHWHCHPWSFFLCKTAPFELFAPVHDQSCILRCTCGLKVNNLYLIPYIKPRSLTQPKHTFKFSAVRWQYSRKRKSCTVRQRATLITRTYKRLVN